MQATMKDVAKLAGVSVSTVSLVVNNSPLIKQETKAKVLDAIHTLGYTPNQYARSLVTKVSKTIVVLRASEYAERSEGYFNTNPGSYFNAMLWDIERNISDAGYSMMLAWHKWEEQDIRLVNPANIDGIICNGGFVRRPFIESVKRSGIPLVLIGARADDVDFIDTDTEDAFYRMTEYVISQGHKRIAYINGPNSTESSARKLKGFQSAMAEAGLEPVKVIQTLFSGKSGYDACEQLLSPDTKPTAIICASDSIALGVERCVVHHHLRCPEDISISGYERTILSEYGVPSLTTMDVHCSELGRRAVSILFNRIHHPEAEHVGELSKATLHIGESVRALSGQD